MLTPTDSKDTSLPTYPNIDDPLPPSVHENTFLSHLWLVVLVLRSAVELRRGFYTMEIGVGVGESIHCVFLVVLSFLSAGLLGLPEK